MGGFDQRLGLKLKKDEDRACFESGTLADLLDTSQASVLAKH
jgi:hypothetical protein